MSAINRRTAPSIYVILMGAWVYGFAASDRDPPAAIVFLLFLLAAALHVAVGYVVGRWEAAALAAVPVVLALAASGIDSPLWVFLFLLAIFPGAPLVAGGVCLRRWREQPEDPLDDLWF